MPNKDNTILIGKYIRKFISENDEVKSVISQSNIFPLIANADTTFPFAVYGRSMLRPIYTKDILTENEVEIVVYVVSNDYIESLEVANAIRHSIEGYRYKDNDIEIDTMKLVSITEKTSEDAYIQEMRFSFTCK